jgi:2-methylcitrate dehydratase PrpD
VQVLPTALASAEWLERSGRDTLAALIFGYEVRVRLGAAMTARPIAHQNGRRLSWARWRPGAACAS